MKPLSLLILAVFLFQYSNAQNINVGAKGGVNISDLHYSDNTSTHSKTGVYLGFFAHIHASEKWALQPEITYSLEGASELAQTSVKINLNYLNVPVLLQYLVGSGFRLEAGPQIDFLLNAKSKSGNITVTSNRFQSTSVSIPIGINYITQLGFGLDARYAFGLSNINNNTNGLTIQSNAFQLGIFYQVSDTKMHKHY